MKNIGKTVIISVFAEQFTNELAKIYFNSLGLEIEKIEQDYFIFKDFTKVKRFTKNEITSWGGKIIETPIGYMTFLR